MEIKYSPSVNIIRDSGKELKYIVTPNAQRVANQIAADFKKGFHSFNIIGSYGTGKSAFLKAFEEYILGDNKYFDTSISSKKGNSRILKFVGEYQSIINTFSENLGVKNKLAGNQEILDAIYQEYEKAAKKGGILLIVVDEIGKFLEYAAKHKPEKELYFIQQLSEFVNEKDRNIIFISTLHQSFESYANGLNEIQKREWIKVKGRLKDLPFNEPVEQLLLLAGEHIRSNSSIKPSKNSIEELINLNKKSRVFSFEPKFADKIGRNIYPLDIYSAYVLTLALQQYGQNERSLFTFLESNDLFGINNWDPKQSNYYSIPHVFDYLFYNYYTFLSSQNKHYVQWTSIKSAIERAESLIETGLPTAVNLLKTIGLLNLFSSKGAKIDIGFLEKYIDLSLGNSDVPKAIKELERHKIIRFNKFTFSYRLIEGTDLDIDEAISNVVSKVDEVTNVVSSLEFYFERSYVSAKAISYKKGTPRNFEVKISEEPITQVPIGDVDGYINLVFNDEMNREQLISVSGNTEEAILYGFFNNTNQIKYQLFEIKKIQKVIEENPDDIVAKKQLKEIIEGHKNLLNHYLIEGFYEEGKIVWAFQGKEVKVNSRKQFNQQLSRICERVYPNSPTYLNELVNRHKIPPTIHSSRKTFFESLVQNWNKENIGFEDGKFPPEKTIYLSLLKGNGIHRETKGGYELSQPNRTSSFNDVWVQCEEFLNTTKQGKRGIVELIEILNTKPFKLKQGLIDFWLPTYLFIKRGDYALYCEGNFISSINETTLYQITRNPEDYDIKAFELSGIRLKLFNKYREYLQLDKKNSLSNESFIESIKPFMVFYKGLPEYCKKTNRLSEEARSLRSAIINAQDPEKVFFEDFPRALKLTLEDISDSNESLAKFSNTLNNAVEEIKGAYSNLLNRIEEFIQNEIVGEKDEFPSYKTNLKKRFASIKEHQLLATQKVFIQRINSPLNDRDSWLASIAQAVIQKPLDQISDEDEFRLEDKFIHLAKELDNLRSLYNEKKTSNEVLKIDLTTKKNGLKSNIIEIPKGKTKDVEKLANEIRKQLKSSKNISLAVLAMLLSEQLNDE